MIQLIQYHKDQDQEIPEFCIEAQQIDVIPPKTICACNTILYNPTLNPDSNYIIFLDVPLPPPPSPITIEDPRNNDPQEIPVEINNNNNNTKNICCYNCCYKCRSCFYCCYYCCIYQWYSICFITMLLILLITTSLSVYFNSK